MIQTNDPNTTCVTDEAPGMPEEPKKSRLTQGQGEVILVVEDEEMLRDFLQMILGENGYRVMLAADGMEGVHTFMQHMNEISLVLLDMGLPGLSGEEVLSRIVSLSPGAKVIAVSGSIEPEVQAGALQLGAVDYLPKPYLTKDLLLKVDHALHGRVQSAG